jgi:deoxyribodipyrimidine photo-lyase
MVQPTRIRFLNAKDVQNGEYVLYWMQASQRAESNHALAYAIRRANELRRPVVVFFGLTGHVPDANARPYVFMLEGLAEVKRALAAKGVAFVVRAVSPEAGAVEMADRACLVVTDRGYLRFQKGWRSAAAERLGCPLIQVETDAVVPVEEASPKEEYAAVTLRPKILKKLKDYLVPVEELRPRKDSLGLEFPALDFDDIAKTVGLLGVDLGIPPSPVYHGGTSEAKKRLKQFLKNKIDHFHDLRNNPALDYLSHLSPYLHFGQISPLQVALEVSRTSSPGKGAFLEELVVRRELSLNFVHYNPHYDAFDGIPFWARKSLAAHQDDSRPALYTRAELEAAKTQDPYWNAAQLEMVRTGKMHGYMRMYWGKKIIEWSPTPEEALETALALNNKYELDGRDPNGFAGVAWCFGKHDRPWQERPVFGNIRYMNDKGLRRKFDVDQYVRNVDRLAG